MGFTDFFSRGPSKRHSRNADVYYYAPLDTADRSTGSLAAYQAANSATSTSRVGSLTASSSAAAAALRRSYHESLGNQGPRTMSMSSRSFRRPSSSVYSGYPSRAMSLQSGYNPYQRRGLNRRPSRTNSLLSESSRNSLGTTATTTTTTKTKRVTDANGQLHTTVVKTTKEQDFEGRTRSITKTTVQRRGELEIVHTTVVKPAATKFPGSSRGSYAGSLLSDTQENELAGIEEEFDGDFTRDIDGIITQSPEFSDHFEQSLASVSPNGLLGISEEPAVKSEEAPAGDLEVPSQLRQPEVQSPTLPVSHEYRQLAEPPAPIIHKPPSPALSPKKSILKRAAESPESHSSPPATKPTGLLISTTAVLDDRSVPLSPGETDEADSDYADAEDERKRGLRSPTSPQREPMIAPSAVSPNFAAMGQSYSATSSNRLARKQVRIPEEFVRTPEVPPATVPQQPRKRLTPEEMYAQAMKVAEKRVYGDKRATNGKTIIAESGGANALEETTKRNTLMNAGDSLSQRAKSPDSGYQANGRGLAMYSLRDPPSSREMKKLRKKQEKLEAKKEARARKEREMEQKREEKESRIRYEMEEKELKQRQKEVAKSAESARSGASSIFTSESKRKRRGLRILGFGRRKQRDIEERQEKLSYVIPSDDRSLEQRPADAEKKLSVEGHETSSLVDEVPASLSQNGLEKSLSVNGKEEHLRDEIERTKQSSIDSGEKESTPVKAEVVNSPTTANIVSTPLSSNVGDASSTTLTQIRSPEPLEIAPGTVNNAESKAVSETPNGDPKITDEKVEAEPVNEASISTGEQFVEAKEYPVQGILSESEQIYVEKPAPVQNGQNQADTVENSIATRTSHKHKNSGKDKIGRKFLRFFNL